MHIGNWLTEVDRDREDDNACHLVRQFMHFDLYLLLQPITSYEKELEHNTT